MEAPFSDDEIKVTIFDMGADKALGLDGLLLPFFSSKILWDSQVGCEESM